MPDGRQRTLVGVKAKGVKGSTTRGGEYNVVCGSFARGDLSLSSSAPPTSSYMCVPHMRFSGRNRVPPIVLV